MPRSHSLAIAETLSRDRRGMNKFCCKIAKAIFPKRPEKSSVRKGTGVQNSFLLPQTREDQRKSKCCESLPLGVFLFKMSNVFIFHGTGGYPEENWFPWLKKELEELECKVIIPKFPSPEN